MPHFHIDKMIKNGIKHILNKTEIVTFVTMGEESKGFLNLFKYNKKA